MTQVRLDRVSMSPAFARSMLTSGAVQRLVLAKAQRVCATANSMYGASGYGVRATGGSGRAHAVVYTGDMHTINSNFKHQTLKKALGR
ncbi:MAG: hypothetical protein LKG38_05460 [Atopobiaceae bacterium]|jgi:hypothetical protein|nr:hypothetical protein [Atopobiaceae bacterium]